MTTAKPVAQVTVSSWDGLPCAQGTNPTCESGQIEPAAAGPFHDFRDRDGNAMEKVYSDWRGWETWPDEKFNERVKL